MNQYQQTCQHEWRRACDFEVKPSWTGEKCIRCDLLKNSNGRVFTEADFARGVR